MFSENNESLRAFYKQLPLGVTVEDYSEVKQTLDQLRRNGIHDLRQYFKEHPDTLSETVGTIQVIDANDSMLKLFRVNTLQEYIDYSNNEELWVNSGLAEFYIQEFVSLLEGKSHFGDNQKIAADGSSIEYRSISWIPIEHADDWSFVITTHEDITERKLAERKVLARDTWMNAIFENAPLEIALKDTEGRIIDISRKVANILGFEREDFIGLTTADFLPSDIAKIYMDSDRKVIETGELLQQEVIEESNGDTRYLMSAKFPVLKQDGSIIGVCSLTNDITNIRKADEQRRHALLEAESANQTKSEFLANMSHELRTPLNAINGFAQMMVDEVFGKHAHPKYFEYSHDVRNSGQHLLEVINDILDLSKIESGETVINEKAFCVQGIIEDCARMLRRLHLDKLERINSEQNSNLIWLKGDKRLFKQIILNLLSNANKFTPDDGEISVSSELDGENRLVVKISDTGRGITPDNLSKVLEPFGQVKVESYITHEGTGLGLPISKKLMELHGGTLKLESEINVGTTITLIFPAERTVIRN